MTLRELLYNKLYRCALFESTCNKILDAFEAEESNDSMKGRWNDKAEHYP